MVEGLGEHLPFLIEIDRLKQVERQSRLAGGSRRENSAEHSWHLALFALSLGKNRPIDMLKVIKMLLIHDLVEIDAGDTPLHGGGPSRQEQLAAENAAARRIFGLLPPEQAAEYQALWNEFERAESEEALFSRAIDRLQPLILNLLNDGGTWAENAVGEQTVLERYGPPISAGLPDLWPEVREMVHRHFAGGSAAPI